MDDFSWLADILEIDPETVSALASQASDCSPALRALAARFDRCLEFSSLTAPGLACIGGLVRLTAHEAACVGAPAISATGAAVLRERAALLCLGEAAELLSPIERPGDLVERGGKTIAPAGWYRQALLGAAAAIDWLPGFRCLDDSPVLLPADLCLRRPAARRRIKPVGALSSGVAGGFDRPSALCRAILELVERDAAALWWFGGRPGRLLAGDGAAREAAAVLAVLRGRDERRQTLLIDITTELGVPVVAAVAWDGDGRGIAIGIAARLSLAAAAAAALTEMGQMEVAAGLALHKIAAGGRDRLGEADRRHLARMAVDARSVAQLRPVEGTAPRPVDLTDGASLAKHLEARHVMLFATDLSRTDIGVPVVRVLSPDLQPFSLEAECERFAAYAPALRPDCPFVPY
jgi:ribosomal protein S12 methylthiotransferase accessory factor